jgi:hypothetical protein
MEKVSISKNGDTGKNHNLRNLKRSHLNTLPFKFAFHPPESQPGRK